LGRLVVIVDATPEGRKELVGLADGLRESAQSWCELLLDLKRRGLSMGPQLAVGDGALGFWKIRGRNAAGCTRPPTSSELTASTYQDSKAWCFMHYAARR